MVPTEKEGGQAGDVNYLSLDLVDGATGVLDVGHEGRRHAARVAQHGDGVGGDAGGGERGEGRGVGDPGRGGEPQPRGDREEHRGVVDVPDCGEHGEYRHRHVPRPPHPSRLVLLLRPAAGAGHSEETKPPRGVAGSDRPEAEASEFGLLRSLLSLAACRAGV